MDDALLSAKAARDALIAELDLTPKPGLVDREQRGAHRDMDYARMRAGAEALAPALHAIARCAADAGAPSTALREEIGAIGRAGERAMLKATGGVNTHRGALWALGLLVAGERFTGPRDVRSIASRAGALARLSDRFAVRSASNGLAVRARYGAGGARDEAARGFPAAVEIALPSLRSGAGTAHALLVLIARLEDTCLLHRGGTAGLRFARNGARRALVAGGSPREVALFGRALRERGLSPGGSADALAAALYLEAVGGA